MAKKLWGIVKFSVLMLSVGILPGIPHEFVLLAVALLAVAILAAPLIPRRPGVLARLVAARPPTLRILRDVQRYWHVPLPGAPGTPGTVRSRAPARTVSAFA